MREAANASDVFLSYSRQDQPAARRVAEALEAQGLSVWWDQVLRAGETYDEVTEAALRRAKCVVVLWSATSVGSRWVRSEATVAQRAGTLVPAMLEPCERPVMFELSQTTDLSGWDGKADHPGWRSLMADLAARLETEVTAISPVTLARSAEFQLPRKPSIAVLPFADLGGGEHDFFADGMVEEISTALSRFSTLFVIAAHSSLGYRNSTKTPQAIGRELGVRYLLEGSVRRSHDRVRIAIKLIDTAAGEQIWADRFDDRLDDVFDLQDRIASNVARTIDLTLQQAEMKRAVVRPTESLDAYELCLRADAALNRYDRTRVIEAADFADRAMAIDPDYAVAVALAAFARGVLYMNGWSEDAEAMRSAALDLGARAQRIGRDDEIALVYVGGMLMNAGGDVKTARRLINRAIEINPERAYSLFWGGWAELESGNPETGLQHFEKSFRISPRSMYRAFQMTGMGNCLFFLDRFDEAAEMQREALALLPAYPAAHAVLVASLAQDGWMDEARAAAKGLEAAGGLQFSLSYFRNAEHRKRVRAAIAMVDTPAERVA